jgi:hypothetical protein
VTAPVARLLLALLLLLAGGGAAAQRDEAQVKAAYVLNFLRFTEWPADAAPPGKDNAFVLALVGTREFADTLRGIAREAEKLGQRPVRVRRIRLDGDDAGALATTLAKAHAVFVQGDAPQATRTVLQLSARLPVLTIGDGAGFASDGGMLGLVPQGQRIVFDANPRAIQAGRLQVSAKVLKLARIVDGSR